MSRDVRAGSQKIRRLDLQLENEECQGKCKWTVMKDVSSTNNVAKVSSIAALGATGCIFNYTYFFGRWKNVGQQK